MILACVGTRFRRGCVPVLAVFGLFVLRASAHLAVSPPLALEDLARRSDLVCKATVIADHAVTDSSFVRQLGFEVHETSMRCPEFRAGLVEQDAQFWLAGLGKGHNPGVGPRKRLSSPQA